MRLGNDCHDKRPTFIFLIDGNISDKSQHCIGSDQQLALHTGTHTPSSVQLHSGRCYTKIRGNGFRLLTQTKISPASLVAIANPDARRPTSIRYQYFSSTSSTLRRAHALSLSFLFFSLLSSLLLLLLFLFTDLCGGYISLYMHFGVKEIEEKLSMEGKLDLRLSFCFSLHCHSWCASGVKLVSWCL